jgi:hypothetical protein
MENMMNLQNFLGKYLPDEWMNSFPSDLDGTNLKGFLEANGFTVVENGDTGSYGFARTEEGYIVSTNGYVSFGNKVI